MSAARASQTVNKSLRCGWALLQSPPPCVVPHLFLFVHEQLCYFEALQCGRFLFPEVLPYRLWE